jgi:uncharacterized membrane protein
MTRSAPPVAAVLLVAALARAQLPVPVLPPGDPGVPPPFPYVEDEPGMGAALLLRGAGLSEEQRHKVHHILAEHRVALRAAKARVRAAQDALADRMTKAGALAAADLAPEIDRLTKAHHDQIDEIVATALAVRAVLSAEQLARAARWKDRFRTVRDQWQDLVDDEPARRP